MNHEPDFGRKLGAGRLRPGIFMPPFSCLLFFACSLANAAERPPNFVVIFTDDQGYADVGCFGATDIVTPRLDAMAAEGMKFTSFYAQPICGPSRAALMTGCYPMRVAERGNIKQIHPILHSDEITIAEILKSAGYATACFGKWDLAKHAQQGFFIDLFPTRQGFDYFFGTPTSNDRVANLYRNEELIEAKSEMAMLTKRYTDEAIDFMRKHKEQRFFVYIPHTMPHTRLAASRQFKGKSKRGLYGDVIEEIDFNVGRILDTINELQLADNTYVIFTSDNGPWLIKNKDFADGRLPTDHGGSAGPLRSGKVSTFEGGVRVPCVVWGPGRVPAGAVCESIASTMDVLPTFAALAGADIPRDRVIDGEDIRHLIHGEFARANADKTYCYYLRVHLQAVRQGKWKLHLPREKAPIGAAPFSPNRHIAPADRNGFAKPFLVNLETDVGETTDVSKQYPDVVKQLLALAELMREDLGDDDRVGKNMRFFDLTGPRPSKPPVPPEKKPTTRKASPQQTRTNTQESIKSVTVTHSDIAGIGEEAGVMRRDPSDIIKINDSYYVWYSKGKISPGYDATIWYATSKDGHKWTEQGMALAKGKPGSWEGASVFTPNILVAEGRYWLFYTGTSRGYQKGFNPDSKIGIAVSDSPNGPWNRLATNPALKNSDHPTEFDSHLVDDACLIVREGKYWFYYKGRQLGKSPSQTQMGLAIADRPQGPYVRHPSNPVIPGNHEVLVWPQGSGVAAMIGTTGPKEITNSILYAEDGINFSKTHQVVDGPWAGGTFRPEAFTQSRTGVVPVWGVEIGQAKGKRRRLPFIQRFDVVVEE